MRGQGLQRDPREVVLGDTGAGRGHGAGGRGGRRPVPRRPGGGKGESPADPQPEGLSVHGARCPGPRVPEVCPQLCLSVNLSSPSKPRRAACCTLDSGAGAGCGEPGLWDHVWVSGRCRERPGLQIWAAREGIGHVAARLRSGPPRFPCGGLEGGGQRGAGSTAPTRDPRQDGGRHPSASRVKVRANPALRC